MPVDLYTLYSTENNSKTRHYCLKIVDDIKNTPVNCGTHRGHGPSQVRSTNGPAAIRNSPAQGITTH